jgi:hypothetical protein
MEARGFQAVRATLAEFLWLDVGESVIVVDGRRVRTFRSAPLTAATVSSAFRPSWRVTATSNSRATTKA